MKFLKFLIPILLVFIGINVAQAANLTVESEKQNYNDEKKLITLEKKVNVNIDDINIKSPKAFLTITPNGKPDTATFVEGARAIQVTPNSKSETKANILKLSLISKEVEATGNVESRMEKLGKPTITIKSDYQSFKVDSNLMEVKDNVIMTYGDIRATSNSAKIWLSKQGGLEYLKLIGNAKITQDKIMVIGDTVDLDAKTSGFQYNNKSNTAVANGNVKIHYNTYVATGPKAVMIADKQTQKPNKIFFSGRSKIKDGDKSIEADKIIITMSPKNFEADGNVKTKINNLSGLDSGK